MINKLLSPTMPFIWPEPRISAGTAWYAPGLPFESAVRAADTLFGVISAIDDRAISWMEGFLADRTDTKLRLVLSLYPTCRTTEAHLQNALRLVKRHGERVAFKVYPEDTLEDRSSNLLCMSGVDGSQAILTGPTENLGFSTVSPTHANLTTLVSPATFEACRKWFDYLWGIAGPLRPEIAASMPRLVIPEGDIEAARQWEAFRGQCLAQDEAELLKVRVQVDPESGEVALFNESGEQVTTPTDEIAVPRLDPFAEVMTRLYELGMLVTIDKLSRIPPLEAPVKPEWFNVQSFRQTGMVRAQTVFKVAPFDDATLKKIERLRRTSGEVLPRFSFALADGVRWIPKQAIPLFENEMTMANEETKQLLGKTVGNDVVSYLATQRARIQADAQQMYQAYHNGEKIPESAVDNILAELKARLEKANNSKILPKVTYSPVAFKPVHTTEWSSPWGPVFSLLKGIAVYPREAMTDKFYWRGIKTTEEDLIKAMNVADDYLVKDYGSRIAQQAAKKELELIQRVEEARADAIEKCHALWALITSGDQTGAQKLNNH